MRVKLSLSLLLCIVVLIAVVLAEQEEVHSEASQHTMSTWSLPQTGMPDKAYRP